MERGISEYHVGDGTWTITVYRLLMLQIKMFCLWTFLSNIVGMFSCC